MSVKFTLFGIDEEINDLLISCNYSDHKVYVFFRDSNVVVNLLENNFVKKVFLIKIFDNMNITDIENQIIIVLMDYFSNPSENA